MQWLRLLLTSVHFRRRVSVEEQRAQKHDRFLRGRQTAYKIFEHSRATRAYEAVQGLLDLFNILLQNDPANFVLFDNGPGSSHISINVGKFDVQTDLVRPSFTRLAFLLSRQQISVQRVIKDVIFRTGETRYQSELDHTSLHLRRKRVARLVWDMDSHDQ